MGADRMPKTIALAFREQVVDHIPTGEHDFRIDRVICFESSD